MKALLICADNIYLTPFIKTYSVILDKLHWKYDIIYWDKNNNEIINNSNYYRFEHSGKNKIFGYFKYRKFIKKKLNNINYNLVIVLNSVLIWILFYELVSNFRKRFIYDIRDYSYEGYWIFRFIQNYVIKNSLLNVISSEGYKNFLPDSKYYISHNSIEIKNNSSKDMREKISFPIRLSFIGLIRFMNMNKKIIDYFKNDERFLIQFIGTNAENLKEYVNRNNIKNVRLIDTFNPSETLKYYCQTDVILNLYGNNTPLLDFALSNKLYYAANLYKPILVCPDTYMDRVVSRNKLGFTLDLDNLEQKEEFIKYLKYLDRAEFIRNCESFSNKVREENAVLERALIEKITELTE